MKKEKKEREKKEKWKTWLERKCFGMIILMHWEGAEDETVVLFTKQCKQVWTRVMGRVGYITCSHRPADFPRYLPSFFPIFLGFQCGSHLLLVHCKWKERHGDTLLYLPLAICNLRRKGRKLWVCSLANDQSTSNISKVWCKQERQKHMFSCSFSCKFPSSKFLFASVLHNFSMNFTLQFLPFLQIYFFSLISCLPATHFGMVKAYLILCLFLHLLHRFISSLRNSMKDIVSKKNLRFLRLKKIRKNEYIILFSETPNLSYQKH